MADSADFARRRREVEAQIARDKARRPEKKTLYPMLPAREGKSPFLSAVKAIGKRMFDRPLKSDSIVADVKMGARGAYEDTAAPIVNFARKPGIGTGAAAGLSVIPVVRFNPKKFIKASELMDNSPRRAIEDLRAFNRDPREYAEEADWRLAENKYGYGVDEDLVPRQFRAAVEMLRGGRLQQFQKSAARLADRLDRAHAGPRRHGNPADMTPDEFMVSDYPVWHSTSSAPGLSQEAIHAGTLTAAFHRALSKAIMGEDPRKTRFVPLAMRGQRKTLHENVAPLRDDPGSDYRSITRGRNFRNFDARTMVERRRDLEGDVIPYVNDVEDPGQVSVQIVNPTGARSHIDIIRDYMATTGEVPRGLSGYRFSALLEKVLREQIEVAKGVRAMSPRFSPREAKRNAFVASTRYR